ncbi:hypothetical protein AQPE_0227 [Aquipluma nitroreducens]|uniref:Uncharacterized protein n=1 Tax=Aquipluma nitroreducens TaxID=2010828 RepID=A0A5K7S3N6_9BACT|nr:hypothetical protein AQPE_0227 [Aquipluma nitroreducens]
MNYIRQLRVFISIEKYTSIISVPAVECGTVRDWIVIFGVK